MSIARRLLFVCCFIASLSLLPASAVAAERLVVHEWGTFTSLQDEAGRALSFINTDDEPVPGFVRGVGPEKALVFPPTEFPLLAQGAPAAHPSVTMRLETPVTYFHLPSGVKAMSLDVSVDFHGGWLTEFFPAAVALSDGKVFPWPKFPELTPKTVGRLTWKDVKLGGEGKFYDTSEHVWLAPRNVRAANVTVGKQHERFLFYRGVANLDAPLRVTRHARRNTLEIAGDFGGAHAVNGQALPPRLWLLDVRPDGTCAYRSVSSTAEEPGRVIALTEATFDEAAYQPDAAALRREMHGVLVSHGLFDDEATAMLSTWELSYFKSPGTRLFFTVPQGWTDRVLPLTLSAPADVTRVMVGRIELVTPRHRDLLKQIAAGPVPNLNEVVAAMAKLQADRARRGAYNALSSGRGDARELGVDVPAIYKAYLDLGRFRTALVVDACASGKPDREPLGDFALEVQAPGTGIAQQRAQARAAAAR